MKNSALLKTFFAKSIDDFLSGMKDMFLQKQLHAFTIWEINDGTICRSVLQVEGISEAIFDIYDLGYNSENQKQIIELNYFGNIYKIYKTFFCETETGIFYALTFHNELKEDDVKWLNSMIYYLSFRAEELYKEERNISIFVDYQRKIDFIKNSSQILRSLTINDVVVNALSFFSKAFRADASCASVDNEFIGFGLTKDDLMTNIFVENVPLYYYKANNQDVIFLDRGFTSNKFQIVNIFILKDEYSNSSFYLFNINVDVMPDKDFSSLITYIIGIAIENARYHSKATKLKIAEAEMIHTADILNEFVIREYEYDKDGQSIFSANYPAKTTSGDYSKVKVTDDYIFCCLADVCGKGYSAAVFTVMLASMLDSGIFDDYWDVEGIANKINSYLLSHSFKDRFITAFIFYYDKKKSKLRYVGCGHEPAIFLTSDKPTIIKSKDLPLGIMDIDYTSYEIDVKPGDSLFIYTDGVIEYIDHNALQVRLESLATTSTKDIVKTLYKELVSDPLEQRDDFTFTAIKF